MAVRRPFFFLVASALLSSSEPVSCRAFVNDHIQQDSMGLAVAAAPVWFGFPAVTRLFGCEHSHSCGLLRGEANSDR